jgi:hypothetical protein
VRALRQAKSLEPDGQAVAERGVHSAFERVVPPGRAGRTERDAGRAVSVVQRTTRREARWVGRRGFILTLVVDRERPANRAWERLQESVW